ncbi:alpha/beta hydrolase [Novipirellula artificiosorum]|uniref:Alpha/beta hydrolase family protein n=1 Tax=Novipirellula artificiosorum TaxID=2528016 RepID=A0A5C6DPX3_9BACT|nr:alpha/beta hydrolase [Novipirellula artificiosorum]TWU37066.1 hypothetical protein Poly41_31920 [Novipirellula artificiosorum]
MTFLEKVRHQRSAIVVFFGSLLFASIVGCSAESARSTEDRSTEDRSTAMETAAMETAASYEQGEVAEWSVEASEDPAFASAENFAAEAIASEPQVDAIDSMPRIRSAPMETRSMNVPLAAPSTPKPVPLGTAGSPARTRSGDHLSHLPAGAEHSPEQGFATVQVFYATDRSRGAVSLSDYEITGQKEAFLFLSVGSLGMVLFGGLLWYRGRTRSGNVALMMGGLTGCLAAACVAVGQANIEKHGVTYGSDRGSLVRGICEVTVPDSHQRGLVERPSLLRFELQENQREHIVLTRAVELASSDFQQRLTETLAASPDGDLLVFIHGYNVSFESAVQRTAQIAVDLPFEGVPVCYSWPSQASLMGYTIDENNSEWTITHLKQFLTDLAEQSGAKSINVVAHSMGNRAMTAAMQQIQWQRDEASPPPFDRIVLAAPDVDADRFRRDLAPALLKVSNQVTLYASSDDQALVASKKVHGYPRAGESGANIVVVPGVETIDVSGIDLSLLGHSYYGDNESMLRDLYELVRVRLPAAQRRMLMARREGELIYWQLAQRQLTDPSLR